MKQIVEKHLRLETWAVLRLDRRGDGGGGGDEASGLLLIRCLLCVMHEIGIENHPLKIWCK